MRRLLPEKKYLIVNAMVRLDGLKFNRANMGTRGDSGEAIVTRNRGGLEILSEDYHNSTPFGRRCRETLEYCCRGREVLSTARAVCDAVHCVTSSLPHALSYYAAPDPGGKAFCSTSSNAYMIRACMHTGVRTPAYMHVT